MGPRACEGKGPTVSPYFLACITRPSPIPNAGAVGGVFEGAVVAGECAPVGAQRTEPDGVLPGRLQGQCRKPPPNTYLLDSQRRCR